MWKKRTEQNNRFHYNRNIFLLVLTLCLAISMPVSVLAAEGGDTPVVEEPETKVTGVVEEEGVYYYYLDGEKKTAEGMITWEDKIYYVLDGGALATDQIISIEDAYYYAGTDAVIVQEAGWIETDGEYYYLNEGGSIKTNGWVTDENGRCYCDNTGKMVRDKWISDGGNWYYLKADGYMAANEWADDSTGRCWLNDSGLIVKNKWILDGGDWYYVKSNGYMAVNTWAKDSKGWCYLGSDGRMVKNDWVKDSKGWCWIASDGYMPVATKWIKADGAWYHITNGYRDQSRWMKDSKGWCYLGADGKMVTNDWAQDSKGWCWMGADGYWISNKWIQSGGQWYYIKSNHYMAASEWAKDSGGWMWMNASGKITKNKWIKTGGYWYFLKSNGYLATSQILKEGDTWYYVNASGKLLKTMKGMNAKAEDSLKPVSGITYADKTVPKSIEGAKVYTFDGSVRGTDENGNSYLLIDVIATNEKKKIILRGTIQFGERYRVGSHTEIDATGATIYSATNDGCLTNTITGVNYNSVTDIIVRGGTWKKKSGYHSHSMMLFAHANNIRIENITEECGYTGHCIELVACSNVVVKNCDLQMKGTYTSSDDDEPLQLDHANGGTAGTIINLKDEESSFSDSQILNNNPCKNVQIVGCTLLGGRGFCTGHCGRDVTPSNKFHSNVVVQNNTITGQTYEALALYDVVGCDVSGNVIKSRSGYMDYSSDGMCIRIPEGETAPSSMSTATIMVRNNIVFGGRAGIILNTQSSSDFGKVVITGNVVFYKGTDNNAITVSKWYKETSSAGCKSSSITNNETCKGW